MRRRRRRRRLHKACAKEILNKRVNYKSNTIQWIHTIIYLYIRQFVVFCNVMQMLTCLHVSTNVENLIMIKQITEIIKNM